MRAWRAVTNEPAATEKLAIRATVQALNFFAFVIMARDRSRQRRQPSIRLVFRPSGAGPSHFQPAFFLVLSGAGCESRGGKCDRSDAPGVFIDNNNANGPGVLFLVDEFVEGDSLTEGPLPGC